MSEPFHATDLAAELEGKGGAVRAAGIAARLQHLGGRIEARIAAGLPVASADDYRAAAIALATAHTLMIRLGSRKVT